MNSKASKDGDRTVYVYPTVLRCINRPDAVRWYMCVPCPGRRKHVVLSQAEAEAPGDWFRRITEKQHRQLCASHRGGSGHGH